MTQQCAVPDACIRVRLKRDAATVADLQAAFLTIAKELNELGLPIQVCFISDDAYLSDPKQADGFLGLTSNATWARSRHRTNAGPSAIRSAQWPWGFPWLDDRQRNEVEAANNELREILFEFNLCNANSPSVRAMYLHPEDLGRADKGIPASPWQLPEVRKWSGKTGLVRLAGYQSEIAALTQDSSPKHRFPVGLLTNTPLGLHPWKQGWPTHQDGRYAGPLPHQCSCGLVHQPAKQRASKDPQDKTSYHQSLLQWLAKVTLREQLNRKELLTDRVARSNVFAALRECEIDDESTWDDSDLRGSKCNLPAEELDQAKQGEEAWDDALSHMLGLKQPQARTV